MYDFDRKIFMNDYFRMKNKIHAQMINQRIIACENKLDILSTATKIKLKELNMLTGNPAKIVILD